MRKTILLGSLAALTFLSACSTTTTRADVRDARRDARDAYRYGDRQDQREANRELGRTEREYRRDRDCRRGYDRAC